MLLCEILLYLKGKMKKKKNNNQNSLNFLVEQILLNVKTFFVHSFLFLAFSRHCMMILIKSDFVEDWPTAISPGLPSRCWLLLFYVNLDQGGNAICYLSEETL